MAGSAGGGGCGLGRCRGIPRQVAKRPNARCSDKKRGKRSEIDVRVAGFNRLSSGSPASLKFAWPFAGYARTRLSRMEVGAHEAARDNGGAPRGPITGRCPARGAGGRTRSRSFDVRQEKRRRPVARAPYSVGLCLRARCDRRLHNPAGTAASTAPRRHLHVTFTLPPVREVTAGCGRPRARRGGARGGAPGRCAGHPRLSPAGPPCPRRAPGRRAGGLLDSVAPRNARAARPGCGVAGPGQDAEAGAVIDGLRAGRGTGRGRCRGVCGGDPGRRPDAARDRGCPFAAARTAGGAGRRETGARPAAGAPVGELDTDHT